MIGFERLFILTNFLLISIRLDTIIFNIIKFISSFHSQLYLMVCERFSFIIICSILSNLAVSNSWATISNVPEANFVPDISMTALNNISRGQEDKITGDYSLENFHQTAQSRFVNQPEPQQDLSNNSTSPEPSPKIDRSLSLVAMAVTSAISLLLLWLLFRKPLPNQEVMAELPAIKEQQDKDIAIARSKLESPKQVEGEITAAQVYSVEDFPQSTQSTVTLVKDESDLAATDMSVIEDLDLNDNLIKTNSNADYTDKILQLMQDLQQSDRNIRRQAMWELAKIGDSRCIKPLMAIMPQGSSVDKSLIIKAITQITHRTFEPVNEQLFALLNDDNPHVRINAILDLTSYYKFVAPITQQLAQMQLDQDLEVRYRAKQALHKLNLNS